MPEFTSHAPGTFSWAELACRDQQAGVAFYSTLFGWDVEDRPIGPEDTYSMCRLRGLEVAAAYTMPREQQQSGAPPRWNLYVSVADADESVTLAQERGGKVLAPSFDVMAHGRMAVLQDPTGGVFQVWQAGNHIGARILYEPGALCWAELTTRDPREAEFFYTSLFEWTAEHTISRPGTEYAEFANQGQESRIGILRMPEGMSPGLPSYWMPYFQVIGCDAVAATAQSLGATIMVPPRDIPRTGRFAILQDPQGAMFGVYEQAPARGRV